MNVKPFIVGILLVVAVLVVTAIVYPQLPERIPTHWNMRGEIDHYGSRTTAFLLPAIMIVLLPLFAWVLPWLSPRRFEVETFQNTYVFIMQTVLGLCAYIQMMILWAALHPPLKMDRVLIGGLFVFLILMGNVLGKVRRNFWVGVRTPWTLADERVWNATHRFAGRLMVITGILGVMVTLCGWPTVAFVLLVAAGLSSVIYSLVYYKRLAGAGRL